MDRNYPWRFQLREGIDMGRMYQVRSCEVGMNPRPAQIPPRGGEEFIGISAHKQPPIILGSGQVLCHQCLEMLLIVGMERIEKDQKGTGSVRSGQMLDEL